MQIRQFRNFSHRTFPTSAYWYRNRFVFAHNITLSSRYHSYELQEIPYARVYMQYNGTKQQVTLYSPTVISVARVHRWNSFRRVRRSSFETLVVGAATGATPVLTLVPTAVVMELAGCSLIENAGSLGALAPIRACITGLRSLFVYCSGPKRGGGVGMPQLCFVVHSPTRTRRIGLKQIGSYERAPLR